LLGHMIIELEMLQTKLEQLPGFPTDLKTLLEHLIISHHGQYEFGSPKLPMFPEALMLHYLDDLDSKMEAIRAHFEREAQLDGPWTSYNPSMGRPLLNSAKFLRTQPVEEPTMSAPPESESEPAQPLSEERAIDLFGEPEGKTEPAVAGTTPRPAKF
jgi:3'-5' exoribonuclease